MMTLTTGQPVPFLTYWGFIALVVVMVVAVSLAARRAAGRGESGSRARNMVPPAVAFVQTLWLMLTGLLAFGGFFARTGSGGPPPFLFGVLPITLLCIALVLVKPSREFLLRIPRARVVSLQAFRVPVELVLWSLARHEVVPKVMTFEGRNFDLITGLAAPLVAYLCFVRRGPVWLAWVWNAVGVLLLANVVGTAILHAPGPFYSPMNGLPNLAPSVFPFVWLPYYLVPLALFGHLISLAQLTQPAPPTRDKTALSPPTSQPAAQPTGPEPRMETGGNTPP